VETLIPVYSALVIAGLNFFGLVYVVATRLSRVESRTEIMWSFLLRRGIIEGLDKGVLTQNSPVSIAPAVLQRYRTVFSKVKEFHDSNGRDLSDMDFSLQIEKHFWPEIRTVCLDAGINDGACLALVLKYVRPQAKVFVDFELESAILKEQQKEN
jgi:hypothetical protein